MNRKIVYLINPVSGISKKSSLVEMLTKKTTQRGIDFDIFYTNAEGDYELLKNKIQDERITDIVICGGDGTVNMIAAALLGVEVNIGIIPVGSGNGLAFAAKIPKQASKALEIVFEGKASFIDGFYVNNKFSCMLCGIGFDALVAHEFARQKRRGLQTYIKVSLTNFFKAEPYSFIIEHDKVSLSVHAFFISIANSNQFGNNFTIAPKARLSDGLLDIVIVKKMNKFMLPFSVLQQVRGVNPIRNITDISSQKNIIYFQTPSLTIYNNGDAPLHIDGEPKQTARRIEIRIISRAIRLIQ
ncbi:MAG TPA: YegS/Rv2252/BmrU family lipid kinase [Puia sp.]|nr:YegS/Rv2252/BmrU family lipid kinase [Puia sp.]